MPFYEDFERDVAQHQMKVLRDDGVDRHIRFSRPGTRIYCFDLITWPGHLCYTGDMGTFVFSRTNDMFEFFRRHPGFSPGRSIPIEYWAQKVLACPVPGIREWSADKFRSDVREYFEEAKKEGQWTEAQAQRLWEFVEEEVLSRAVDGMIDASEALNEFDHDGFSFVEVEFNSSVWTHHFMWCCHALEWAIGVYDAAKAPAAGQPPGAPGSATDTFPPGSVFWTDPRTGKERHARPGEPFYSTGLMMAEFVMGEGGQRKPFAGD